MSISMITMIECSFCKKYSNGSMKATDDLQKLMCQECYKLYLEGNLDSGETCQCCGKVYREVWQCADELWQKVTEIKNGSGALCMDCFKSKAFQKGVNLVFALQEIKG